MPEKPFIELGGDAKGAVNAVERTTKAFRDLKREGDKLGKGIGRSFGLAGKAMGGLNKILKANMRLMRGAARLAGGAFSFAYRKARLGVLGLTAAAIASTHAWNKEAAAQARINAVLRANIRDFPRARRELDKLIRSIQRTTNFGDRDVEGIFAILTGMAGRQGFEAARRLTGTFLDIETVTGGQFRAVELAKKTAKALQIRDPGEFREVGLVINKAQFARDPIGTLLEKLQPFGAGAAAAERKAAPFRGLAQNLGDVIEPFGKLIADRINPALEKMALWANDVAALFKPDNSKRFWDEMRAAAANAWTNITKFAFASFAGIKAFAMEMFNIGIGGKGAKPVMAHQAGIMPPHTIGNQYLPGMPHGTFNPFSLKGAKRYYKNKFEQGKAKLKQGIQRMIQPGSFESALAAGNAAFQETAKDLGLDLSVFKPEAARKAGGEIAGGPSGMTSREMWELRKRYVRVEKAAARDYLRFIDQSQGGLTGEDFASARELFPNALGSQEFRSEQRRAADMRERNRATSFSALSLDTLNTSVRRGAAMAVN